MAKYSFITTWRIPAPIDKVWDALSVPQLWWPNLLSSVTLTPGVNGVGARYERVTRGRLPYSLRYVITMTLVDRPNEMAYDSEGDLAGRGRMVLRPAGGVTEVVFYWDVETTGRWLNRLAPLLKPLFAWNHTHVMREGEKGLTRYLREQAGGAATP
jgi:hypothetical protein